ncbi:MAG: 30S ribosomal protein S24e [Candidatus Helarchaeota archaeon]
MSWNLIILKEFDNSLLNRKQINFKIIHEKMATPTRDEVKRKLAAQFNADPNTIIIDKLLPRFGQATTVGFAKIYNSPEDLTIEPKYIIKRNQPKEQKE